MITENRSIQLTARDLDILAHVLRFRMTTAEGIHRLFCPELAPDGAGSLIRRLREGAYLRAAPLIDNKCYYYLTPAGARRVGHLENLAKPEQAGRPLEQQARTRAYAVFNYCCLLPVRRDYLSRYEMDANFSQYCAPGLPQTPYYLHEENGRTRLAFIIIDYGGAFNHPAIKYSEAVVRRLKLDSFRRLILEDKFTITILTNLEVDSEKANQRIERLEEAMAERERLVDYRIVGIPQLFDVNAKRERRRHAAQR